MDNTQLILSVYSRNILEELRSHVGRLLKAREPELMKLAKMPGMRIIEARDKLEKCLNELREGNLIIYEKQGDKYLIRDVGE